MQRRDERIRNRTITFFKHFLIVQVIFTPLFCCWHLYDDNHTFFISLLIFLTVNIIMLFAINRHNECFFYRISSLLLSAMTLFVVYTFPEVHIYYIFFLALPLIFFILLGEKEGKWWASLLFIPLSLMYFFIHIPAHNEDFEIQTIILFLSIIFVYIGISYLGYLIEIILTDAYQQEKEASNELARKNRELQQAFKEIKTLKETLPVCSNCKKIRDESGEYLSMEVYLKKHTDTKITHSLCPDCLRELYPDIADSVLEDDKKTHENNS